MKVFLCVQKDEDHLHRLSHLQHQAPLVGKSKKHIILYACLSIKKLCDLFGWLFLQGSAIDQKSRFRMMIGTFDQEMRKPWSVDDFCQWISWNSQLSKMTKGWDLLGSFKILSNEGLFRGPEHGYGRASPALFEIVSLLQV